MKQKFKSFNFFSCKCQYLSQSDSSNAVTHTDFQSALNYFTLRSLADQKLMYYKNIIMSTISMLHFQYQLQILK